MAHEHNVIDADKHFKIDPITRLITNEAEKLVIAQGDILSECFTFEIPKTVEGHDMTLCNRVEIHFINVDAATKEQSKDYSVIEDVTIAEEAPDTIIFSWCLPDTAAVYAGSLSFVVKFKCLDENGEILYRWGTFAFKGITVGESYDNEAAVVEKHADVIAAWEAELAAVEAKQNKVIATFNTLNELCSYDFKQFRLNFIFLSGDLTAYTEEGECISVYVEKHGNNSIVSRTLYLYNLRTFKQYKVDLIGKKIAYVTPKDIIVFDEGEYFDAEDVEGVLQEIGSILSGLNAYDVADIVKMNIKQTALATSCGGLFANIKDNIIMSCSTSQGWTDMPNSSGDVFINWRYGTNYNIQLSFDQTTGVTLRRIVNRNTGAIYNDWKLLDGTQYVNILALGDSICRGVRNSEKGFVGDLGFPYKNIGVSSATISNVTTTVTNIPDQLVNLKSTDPDYFPDIIIGEGGINDWSKGAPLGVLSAVPVSTDAEAEALDRSTVIGGLEYLLYKMVSLYPKAQRFFLITHKTWKTNVSSYCPTTQNAAGWTQQDLHDAIVECCNAYNVKVIDIYNDSMMNTLFSQYRSTVAYNDNNSVTNTEYCDFDGVHPLAYGYKECYVPIIRKAIGIGTAK